MADRAQTEVLGYVLVFAVIVLTVALVTGPGQAGLQNARDAQRTANVEEGFAVLAENVDDVVREGVPSRATEFDLSGQRVALGEPVTVRVNATYTANGTTAFDRTQSIRPITYRAESGAELVYVNGAVIARGQDGGVAMLREPRLVLGPDRAVVPVINTSLDRQQLRGREEVVDRESRLLVRAEERGDPAVNRTTAEVTLTVEITSPRAAAWEAYLERALGTTCSRTGDTVACSYETGAATLVVTRVDISLE